MTVEDKRASRYDWSKTTAGEHVVQFYETDTFLVDGVADLIGTAIQADDAGIVVTTPEHRAGIETRLRTSGVDPDAATANDHYFVLDAAETLKRIMVDGAPDPLLFSELLGGIITQAATGQRRVHVFGEMVALLAVEGNHTAAIELEQLWNDLQKTHAFSLLCAYPMNHLGGESLTELFSHVCTEHSRVIPTESYTELPTPDDRLQAISLLQQKAQSLEVEVAERRRIEEQLQAALASERAARQETEAALRLRDEFLSIAAHELRTPLAVLSGHAQLIARRLERQGLGEPERLAQGLATVTGQADTLSRLLDEFLDVSRLDAGKLQLDRKLTDLTSLVRQVVSGVRVYNDRHNITITAPPALEARVDPLRMEQVLANLLNNAIKHNRNGEPIEVVLTRPTPATVELSVQDHGSGISHEKRDHIFERFYQAHDNSYKNGLGLGLYISRQIVELHNGEIHAEFPPAGGARFIVQLPIESGEPNTTIASA